MSGEEEKLIFKSRAPRSNCKVYLLYTALVTAAAATVMFAAGLLIGRAVFGGASAAVQAAWGANVTDGGTSVPVLSWIDDKLLTSNIRNNLQELTVLPHIAGSPQNMKLALDLYTQWVNYGFDDVQLVNYSVLLSYPNTSNPNVLVLKNSTGNVIYDAHTAQETPLTPGEDDSTVAMPFNAYSGSGNAIGRLVYVNYATIDDFLFLTTNLSLNLTGRICISRYGGIYRGDKAHLAQKYGCSALIIYSDPQDYAPNGTQVYPNGPSLPPYGLQRGSLLEPEGDPLTYLVPSLGKCCMECLCLEGEEGMRVGEGRKREGGRESEGRKWEGGRESEGRKWEGMREGEGRKWEGGREIEGRKWEGEKDGEEKCGM